jgi:hypothetical protein
VSVVGLDHVRLAFPAGCEAETPRCFGELPGLPGPLSVRFLATEAR